MADKAQPQRPSQQRGLTPPVNGIDLTRRARDVWCVDFGTGMGVEEAALYEAPFQHVMREVKPLRDQNNRDTYRNFWWRFAEARPGMRAALAGMQRFIITPHVSKHRLFVWLVPSVLPDQMLLATARSDDTTFGILHSRFHELWALRMGTSLEDRPRYTPTTTFETLPFPDGLTPNLNPSAYTNPHAEAIAQAALRLNELRENWLNPPEWSGRVPEVVPGYPDRINPKPGHEAGLKERTLTNLYNQNPAWLQNAHRALDQAVAAAYGWPADLAETRSSAACCNSTSLVRKVLSLEPGLSIGSLAPGRSKGCRSAFRPTCRAEARPTG